MVEPNMGLVKYEFCETIWIFCKRDSSFWWLKTCFPAQSSIEILSSIMELQDAWLEIPQCLLIWVFYEKKRNIWHAGKVVSDASALLLKNRQNCSSDWSSVFGKYKHFILGFTCICKIVWLLFIGLCSKSVGRNHVHL